jgi:hypothetical protein
VSETVDANMAFTVMPQLLFAAERKMQLVRQRFAPRERSKADTATGLSIWSIDVFTRRKREAKDYGFVARIKGEGPCASSVR